MQGRASKKGDGDISTVTNGIQIARHDDVGNSHSFKFNIYMK